MTNICIKNESSYPTSTWVDFASVSPIESFKLREVGSTKLFPVVKGNDGFYSTKIDIRPKTTIWLQPVESEDGIQDYTFKLSDWISDKIESLIPIIQIRTPSTIMYVNITDITLVEDNEAVKIYELVGVKDGWKVRMNIKIYSEQDIAEFQFTVCWSDRANSSWTTEIVEVGMSTIEEYHFDYAKTLGIVKSKYPESYYYSLYKAANVFDGQPLTFRGAIFCRPGWMNSLTEKTKLNILPDLEHQFMMQNQDRFTNFMAREEFPVVGMDDWISGMGVSKIRVRNYHSASTDMAGRIASHQSAMQFANTHYATRWYGNTPNTGGTGDQNVFGVIKDAATILTQDPRFLHVLGYHHNYPMRPFHWHEQNGKPLQAKDHPNCVTWNMLPDHRIGSDMLGKPRAWVPTNFAGGYLGPDEEHRQQLYETFAATLGREPILRWSFEAALEADLMARKNRMGAPRAVGRQVDTWMEYLPLLPKSNAKILSLINDKINATKAQWVGKNVPGPVKPVNTVGANSRGLTNFDYWVPWESSLFSIGVYKYATVFQDAEMLEILRQVTRSVVEFGFIWDGTKYLVITCVKWNPDGSPVVITDVAAQIGTGSDKELRTDSNLLNWTLPALQVYLNLTDHLDFNDPMRIKALDVLSTFAGTITSGRQSEWLSLR